MITSDEILKSALALYENDRQKANDEAYKNMQTALSDGEFSRAYYAIKDLNLKIARLEFEEAASGDIAPLKRERELLIAKRDEALKKLNLSEKSLKPAYTCEKCSDTGYMPDGGTCDCFFKKLTLCAEKFLGVTKPKLPAFDDFSCELASENFKNKLLSYCEHFDQTERRNLIFSGKPGTGKSFAAGCIASELEKRGKNVLFLSALKLSEIFFTYHVTSGSDQRAIFETLTTCDLLVIDDLGTEPLKNNVTVEYLTAFLSERLNNGKAFIITTNLSNNDLLSRYGERLTSRLSSNTCAQFSLNGKDLRRA